MHSHSLIWMHTRFGSSKRPLLTLPSFEVGGPVVDKTNYLRYCSLVFFLSLLFTLPSSSFSFYLTSSLSFSLSLFAFIEFLCINLSQTSLIISRYFFCHFLSLLLDTFECLFCSHDAHHKNSL